MVVKLNKADHFPEMFEKEALGLKKLSVANALRIPEVFAYGTIQKEAYLLLEYLSTSSKKENFWLNFSEGLAKQHQVSQSTFGLEEDNYIGSLPQYNISTITNAAEFYIEKRLKPQFQLASKNGFSFQNLNRFYQNIAELIPKEQPSLIHGDLWNGNYLVDELGNPALIDPATCFAPREMDLAMMQLFGGFPLEVFQNYEEIFPLENQWKERIPLWQLYYLLVHLNLFGRGYLVSVENILRKFS